VILIGSAAAAAGGFLPPWRGGVVRDLDIVCEPEEILDLARLTGFTLHQIFPDKYLVTDTPKVIELSVYPAAAVEAIEALCGVGDVSLAAEISIECHVAPLEVVWATLVETVGCFPVPREKSTRDLEHYQSLVDARGGVTSAHLQIADFYRRRTIAQLRGAAGADPNPAEE